MMQKKQSRQNVDVFGTFLRKPSTSKSSIARQVTQTEAQEPVGSVFDDDPASTILDYLKVNGVSNLRDMLSALDGNTKLYLDTIQQLEGFDLVSRDKDNDGHATIRLN